MAEARAGLVLGYGSIGRRHARILSELTETLAIVNRREAVREQARGAHPSARVTDSLDALDALGFPWKESLAVIATWGPSHFDFFSRLADRGVRRILCEKPMAVSVEQAAAMVRRAEEEGIVLGVNHYLRYAELAPSLRRFLELHDLGEPVGITVGGGASCLVTNGIHWIDFAIELFREEPEEVVGLLRGEPINPRSPELLYFGGAATWRFSGGREASFLLSNRCSVFPILKVYLPEAVAELSYEVGADDAYMQASVSRGPNGGDEPVLVGRLPGFRLFFDGIRAALEDVGRGSASRSPGRAGAAAVSAVAGALWSGSEGAAVPLPISPTSPAGRREWAIS